MSDILYLSDSFGKESERSMHNNRTENFSSINSFGVTFLCAAIFPLATLFAILIIWKILRRFCGNSDNSTSSSTGNTRQIIRSSLSSGHYVSQDSANTLPNLHSIYFVDLTALPVPQVSTNKKEEPPPSYQDEVLSLPSYDDAIKNLRR